MNHSAAATDNTPDPNAVVMLSATKFLVASAVIALVMLVLGRMTSISMWLLASEVFATILALFLLGSFKYQLHKNALTLGAGMIISATFMGVWWTNHDQRGALTAAEVADWWPVLRSQLLTFHGLDDLVHADTMLFILGLTFFVCVIAQTRLLEGITIYLLRRNGGRVLPTVLAVTAVVAFSSGILDGVSMIGLTIRTLVIILILARTPIASIRFSVIICTVVTTVCGMWLAYGEPPNLIMKSNLIAEDGKPYLTDGFFLRYCMPAAVASYLCVAWSLWRRLRGVRVDLASLDVLDANAASVRFLQASRHGEVFSAVEFVEDHQSQLAPHGPAVLERVRKGEPLGAAMVRQQVPVAARKELLGKFVDESLTAQLDEHYVLEVAGQSPGIDAGEASVQKALDALRHQRHRAQLFGALALVPFIGLLVAHGINHDIPLFLASFTAFGVAIIGIFSLPKVRSLALHEAKHEFSEYYFLFPLFLSISLLTKVGFFDQLQSALRDGIEHTGPLAMAMAQFAGATGLSAILDNNVVADFASHALHGLPIALLHLFALAQIAGYAVGGCWTHIGSAQSVVAFAFIRRDVDEKFTPMSWIKEMTPTLLLIFIVLAIVIGVESLIIK